MSQVLKKIGYILGRPTQNKFPLIFRNHWQSHYFPNGLDLITHYKPPGFKTSTFIFSSKDNFMNFEKIFNKS